MRRLTDLFSFSNSSEEDGQINDKNWSRMLKDFQITITFLSVSVGVGLAILFWQNIGDSLVAILSAFACLAAGGIMGFLFGVPRVFQNDGSRSSAEPNADRDNPSGHPPEPTPSMPTYRMQVNTNLEQISDWLTKIIVVLA